MSGMEGFINFNGTLEGSIAGGGGGDVTDVKVRDSQETTFESVVNEEGVAEIDLISYVRRNELTQAIENIENSIDNVEQLVDTKQNIINYSTDEQVIGTWTDGKPLYQKMLKSNSGIAQNSWVSIINDSSIRIKNYYGFIYYSTDLEDGTKYPLDWTRVASSAYSCTECRGGDLEVIQNIATSYGYEIIIQYTKTTD